IDPVIGYKAHLLYFLKRDIISFNELPRQVRKDADYRAFCRCEGVAFTAGYLSLFRKHHLTDDMAQQLHQDILTALDIESSTEPLRLGIWDSVPMPSYTTPQKDTKHCDCIDSCDCTKHFSDGDAQIGWQRPTPTKKDKFVGYRKHTIFAYDADKNHRLPLATAVAPANQADINVIEKVLEQCYEDIHMPLRDAATTFSGRRAVFQMGACNTWGRAENSQEFHPSPPQTDQIRPILGKIRRALHQ
ncbi:MAG: hypothetical protein QF732_13010, partial [Nitrospinaceae bacterium]|nr:hypothetical protein [Nitrospinaceae bacterium]